MCCALSVFQLKSAQGGTVGVCGAALGCEAPHMKGLTRITSNPARMNGQPCIRDLRLTVKRVLEAMAIYPDREELRREYPELEDEDILQALTYAAAVLDDEIIELPKTA